MPLPNPAAPVAGPSARVLVAHEPLAYREALAAALAALRPAAEVLAVDPAALDRAVERARPDLVFCGELTAAVRAAAPAWVLVYPGGAPRVEISVAGTCWTAPDLGLEAAVALLDRAAALVRRTPAAPRRRA